MLRRCQNEAEINLVLQSSVDAGRVEDFAEPITNLNFAGLPYLSYDRLAQKHLSQIAFGQLLYDPTSTLNQGIGL